MHAPVCCPRAHMHMAGQNNLALPRMAPSPQDAVQTLAHSGCRRRRRAWMLQVAERLQEAIKGLQALVNDLRAACDEVVLGAGRAKREVEASRHALKAALRCACRWRCCAVLCCAVLCCASPEMDFVAPAASERQASAFAW